MTGRLRVAIVAPPWIAVPPAGYGGVEAAVHALVGGLVALGHHVEVCTVGASDVPARMHWHFPEARYDQIFRPLYDNVAIPLTHLLAARRVIREAGPFDVVHDHNYLLGPIVLGLDDGGPPVLHTLHGPFFAPSPDGPAPNLDLYDALADEERLWFNGISRAQLRDAPAALRPRLLGVVHNGLDVDEVPSAEGRRDGYVTLARFAPEKGHDVAARVCRARGEGLRLAGSVGTLDTPAAVRAALDDPSSPHWTNRELVHFAEHVRPHLCPPRIEYVGAVRGLDKLALLGSARALLLPIDWDEPFGVVAVEALACGTPVIAYRRGALPEIVEDGVTGFLVDDERSLAAVLDRVDELDRRACRRSAVARFSGAGMARAYVSLYQQVVARAAVPAADVTGPYR